MNQLTNTIVDIYVWAKRDYREWPLRFSLEAIAWGLSIGCSIIMAMTSPTPPLIYLYPFWILGCSIYGWASWTRGSFGMLSNYILLVSIDSIGLFRMISKITE
jgi:hypothetical protein